MENKKIVIFDFDGVLFNTLDLAFLLQKEKNPEITKEYFNLLSYGNFMKNYSKALEEGKLIDIPDFQSKYLEGLLNIDTEELIRDLVLFFKEKYILAIVSSTMSSHIHKKLKQEKIDDCFSDVLGTDVHLSKVVKIKKLLKQYNISASDAIFITDTLGDIKEGNECNVKTVGVTWGLHDKKTLLEGDPLCVVENVVELKNAVQEFFSKN